MRFLKLIYSAFAVTLCLVCIAPDANAIVVSPPSPATQKTDSPIIITGYAFLGPKLSYVQLFNTSDTIVDVSGWQLQFTTADSPAPIELTLLQGLVKPNGYVVAADTSAIATADYGYTLTIPPTMTGAVNAIQLLPASLYLGHSVAVKVDTNHQHWRRNISTTTGNYLSSFASFTPSVSFVLYGNGLYEYPETTAVQVAEVLANPRACSPLEVVGDCVDYVKLYNPSTRSIDLSAFRMRVGYVGQTPSSSNTFALAGSLASGQYAVIAKSGDNRPLSLTNSGGFLWLEDAYGLKVYESTVLEYPDASADTRKGQAWAYDSADGLWKWTTQPTPLNSPSVFPVIAAKPKVQANSSLAPCKEGQYRSEETNRCRSLASDATVLAPCDDDEERNPATGRCRKLASLASQQLAACKEGQERNPETNRCRSSAASTPGDAAFAVETVGEAGKAFVGWWALGGVGVMGLGYGAWEWRREVVGLVQKIGSFFTSSK